ncbi:MAG: DUF6690 family protein [Pirellulales bacterium]
MFTRSVMVPTLLVASIGVPYAVTHSPEWDLDWNSISKSKLVSYFESNSEDKKPPTTQFAEIPGPSGVLPPLKLQPSETSIYRVSSPLEGQPTMTLDEVLRMDVTKEWVYQRWPRKSTGLANLNDFGVRVPLVTGTRITDLAGSLTYRFDAQGHVTRISFQGRTGDTTELVMLLVKRYHLTRQPSTIVGTQLFQHRRGIEVISELRTQPAAILWSSSPHNSFDVELELQRPNGNPLPPKPVLVATQEKGQATEPQSASVAQSAEMEKAASSESSDDAPADSKESWNRLFPRSQITPERAEYLNQTRM